MTRPGSARSTRLRIILPAVLAALSLGLAACGGGNGDGGGSGANARRLQVMVVNLSKADATVTSTSGGDPQTVKQCVAQAVDFPLADPFTFAIDNKTVIDSSTIPGGLPGHGDATVLAQVTIQKDGSTTVDEKAHAGRTGSLAPPSTLYVRTSCAGTPPAAS